MKTLTVAELAEWCIAQGIELESCRPKIPSEYTRFLRFAVPKSANRLTWFCRFIEAKLQPRDRCLLWVTAWGIWGSSENWHIYYRLRQSYGDAKLLEEAPGHLFLEYETPDLVSFMQIALIAGWDIHLLPSNGYGRAFVSHDGWVELTMVDSIELDNIKSQLIDSGIEIR